MRFNKSHYGLLWFPSIRSMAYLDVIKGCGALPSTIIVLKNDNLLAPDVLEEFRRLGYSDTYFDPEQCIEAFAHEYNIPIAVTNAKSINDPEIQHTLDSISIEDWLFTGGGILKAPLFKQGRRFLHVHPGKLPEYRGSTCFYYSLLAGDGLFASAFFLTPELDKGEVIVEERFSLNVSISDRNKYFIDYVVDPWIRSQVLLKLLKAELTSCRKSPVNVTASDILLDRAYYVMHPLLRAMTINKLNQCFDESEPVGVFLDER